MSLRLEWTPGGAVAVTVAVGSIGLLDIEIADGRHVVGHAPGRMAVAADVCAGRADVDRADRVQADGRARQLRLKPLARLVEGVVWVAAEHGEAGRRARAGHCPVVAALAAGVTTRYRAGRAVGRPRHDGLLAGLDLQKGFQQVGRQRPARRFDEGDRLQPPGQHPPAPPPQRDRVGGCPRRRLIVEDAEFLGQRSGLDSGPAPSVDPGGHAFQQRRSRTADRLRDGVGRCRDADGQHLAIVRQRLRSHDRGQFAADPAPHVVQLPESLAGDRVA